LVLHSVPWENLAADATTISVRNTNTIISIILKTAAAIAAASLISGTTLAANNSRIEQGKYLLHAGGCISCHTTEDEEALPLSGGRPIDSPFGTFYSPNITPDIETGIGSWSDDDFAAALRDGINPDGEAYYPAFPYTSFTGLSRSDVLAIKAYLFSLKPVYKKNHEHDLPLIVSSRLAAGIWRKLYFKNKRFREDPGKSAAWNRGAYLVRHLGHCGECHTPRGRLGNLKRNHELAGNPDFGDEASTPNITPDTEDGIGYWSQSDIEYFLDIGMFPDGDFAGGAMVDVIEDNTSRLTREDRLAIASYLKSLPLR